MSKPIGLHSTISKEWKTKPTVKYHQTILLFFSTGRWMPHMAQLAHDAMGRQNRKAPHHIAHNTNTLHITHYTYCTQHQTQVIKSGLYCSVILTERKVSPPIQVRKPELPPERHPGLVSRTHPLGQLVEPRPLQLDLFWCFAAFSGSLFTFFTLLSFWFLLTGGHWNVNEYNKAKCIARWACARVP